MKKKYMKKKVMSPISFNRFPNDNYLDSSKLKEFADDNFKYDEKWRKVLKKGRKHCGRRNYMDRCSCRHDITKVLLKHKNTKYFGIKKNICSKRRGKKTLLNKSS